MSLASFLYGLCGDLSSPLAWYAYRGSTAGYWQSLHLQSVLTQPPSSTKSRGHGTCPRNRCFLISCLVPPIQPPTALKLVSKASTRSSKWGSKGGITLAVRAPPSSLGAARAPSSFARAACNPNKLLSAVSPSLPPNTRTLLATGHPACIGPTTSPHGHMAGLRR